MRRRDGVRKSSWVDLVLVVAFAAILLMRRRDGVRKTSWVDFFVGGTMRERISSDEWREGGCSEQLSYTPKFISYRSERGTSKKHERVM